MRKLIGISGKKQSGKNTVAKIWQLLDVWHNNINGIMPNNLPNSIEDSKKLFLNDIEFIRFNIVYDLINKVSSWQQKSYAHKLKEIVCLLIGCTMEQLEDNEFKNTPLPKIWWKYNLPPYNRLNGGLDYIESCKLFGENNLAEIFIQRTTPRLLLQLLGTECGRDIIHPNIWINALFSDYNPIDNRTFQDPDDSNIDYPKWIISDVRFENEAKAIKERNGIIIRVNRNSENKDNHQSEIDLDNYKEFEYIIDNDGNLKDLIFKVKSIMRKEGVI